MASRAGMRAPVDARGVGGLPRGPACTAASAVRTQVPAPRCTHAVNSERGWVQSPLGLLEPAP
eukprot:6643092-Pyramimonas_sp.AAC.1